MRSGDGSTIINGSGRKNLLDMTLLASGAVVKQWARDFPRGYGHGNFGSGRDAGPYVRQANHALRLPMTRSCPQGQANRSQTKFYLGQINGRSAWPMDITTRSFTSTVWQMVKCRPRDSAVHHPSDRQCQMLPRSLSWSWYRHSSELFPLGVGLICQPRAH